MNYRIIIPKNMMPKPNQDERRTAAILSRHFKSDIFFIPREPNTPTPDIRVRSITWEIKNPEGNSKTTIANQFKRAKKQSQNLCLDLHHIKLNEIKAISHAKSQFFTQRKFKRLIIITKSNKIIVFP